MQVTINKEQIAECTILEIFKSFKRENKSQNRELKNRGRHRKQLIK